MRARWLKAFKRFAREKSGAAALEFAMVAIPFFLLTFGLAEVAMIGFTQTTLDYAVSETAREIRTGATQTNRATSGAVKQGAVRRA
ncbi:MAG: TadE family protein [Terricaulis sp.]